MKMIENDLNYISNKILSIAPVNWEVDISYDSGFLYIERKDGKMMRQADITFFEEAGQDIAKLVIEVKQLREINAALKRQIIQDTKAKNDIDKDLRFV
jgi:hypothetical protein